MGGIQGSLKFGGLAAYSSAKGAVITSVRIVGRRIQGSANRFQCAGYWRGTNRNASRSISRLQSPSFCARNGQLHLRLLTYRQQIL